MASLIKVSSLWCLVLYAHLQGLIMRIHDWSWLCASHDVRLCWKFSRFVFTMIDIYICIFWCLSIWKFIKTLVCVSACGMIMYMCSLRVSILLLFWGLVVYAFNKEGDYMYFMRPMFSQNKNSAKSLVIIVWTHFKRKKRKSLAKNQLSGM